MMTIEKIENLIKRYGCEVNNAMHCSHVGEDYDEKRIDKAYSRLVRAIEKWNHSAEPVVSKMKNDEHEMVKKFFEDAIKILDKGLAKINGKKTE